MLKFHYNYTNDLRNIGKRALLAFSFSALILFHNLSAQSFSNIIYTQVPVTELSVLSIRNDFFSPHKKYVKNCRIVRQDSPNQVPINLTPDFYSALDPNISFDGKYVLFSGKKDIDDFWQIWKMKIDGSEKSQITKAHGDCIMPIYAGNRFYLNDLFPTPQIIYVGNEHNWYNNLEGEKIYALYGTDLKGAVVHKLTYNLYSDFSPAVLPNGRIVYSSIQSTDQGIYQNGKVAFFSVNNDGTDLMPFYGNHEKPLYKNDINISSYDQSIYFIESDSSDVLGGGDIAYLSQRRSLHSYKKITESIDGYYLNPCPLTNDNLIVSFRFDNNDAYALYIFDLKKGELGKQLIKSVGWHNLDAQIIAPRPFVKGRSNWLIPGAVNGVFYCLNSYQTNLERKPKINLGDFKFVRIIEGLAIKNNSLKSNLSPEEPARIIGIAPVEEDGSFQVRVPAKTPLSFQMLDVNQMTIDRQNTWTWVIGNENRGCIGCHENRELSPPNVFVDALKKLPVELIPAIEDRRTVDYCNQIAPIIRKNCTSSECHVPGKALPVLGSEKVLQDGFDTYQTLLLPIENRPEETYVIPGFARQSPLIWHLLGKRLDTGNIYSANEIFQMPPKSSLSEDEKLLFIEWIDLGAHWDLKQTDFLKSNNN